MVDIQVIDRAQRCALERRFVVGVDFSLHTSLAEAETAKPIMLIVRPGMSGNRNAPVAANGAAETEKINETSPAKKGKMVDAKPKPKSEGTKTKKGKIEKKTPDEIESEDESKSKENNSADREDVLFSGGLDVGNLHDALNVEPEALPVPVPSSTSTTLPLDAKGPDSPRASLQMEYELAPPAFAFDAQETAITKTIKPARRSKGAEIFSDQSSEDAASSSRPASAEFRAPRPRPSADEVDSKPNNDAVPRITREACTIWRVSRRALGVLVTYKTTGTVNPDQSKTSESKDGDSAASKPVPPKVEWVTIGVVPSILPTTKAGTGWIKGADAEQNGWSREQDLDSSKAIRTARTRVRLLPSLLDGATAWTQPDWISHGPWARISMRFAQDLQDDLMNLAVISNRCEILVTSQYVQLTSQYRSGKSGLAVRYHTTGSGGVTTKSVPPPPQNETKETSKKNRKKPATEAKTKSGGSAKGGIPAIYAAAIAANNNKRCIPRLTIDLFPSSDPQEQETKIETAFSLRGLRIMHRLVGYCARIEWWVGQGVPPCILFFVGAAPFERRVAVISATC